jgi:excisionase family DNA binding protein
MPGARSPRGTVGKGILPMPDTDDILTTGEAAALCGVSRSTLRRAVAQGQLTAWHTPGKHLRFTRTSCMDFARQLGRVDLVGRGYGEGGPSANGREAVEAQQAGTR